MTERDFIYWLHGFFDLMNAEPTGGSLNLTAPQRELVRKHIALVRATEGTYSVVASIEGLLALDNSGEAIQAVLKAQLIQVIDPKDPKGLGDGTDTSETILAIQKKIEAIPRSRLRRQHGFGGGPLIC